jgi:hypothetical protein
MDQGQFYLVLVLAIIYLPLLVSGFWAGAGIWKFLAFAFCTLAIVSIFFVSVPVGILCWLVGWVFGGIALGSIRRTRREDKMLHAIEEQTRLLRQSQEIAAGSANVTGNVPDYRGYTYRLAENGEAELKLSSGAWRKFPSTQYLKAYVDAVLGGGRSATVVASVKPTTEP